MSEDALREDVNDRFEQIERRIEHSVGAVSEQFGEHRAYTEFRYEQLDKAFQSIAAGIARLERKLDRILAIVVESKRWRT